MNPPLTEADLTFQKHHAILADLVAFRRAGPGLNPLDPYAAPIRRLTELMNRYALAANPRKANACREAIAAIERAREHKRAGYNLVRRHISYRGVVPGALAIYIDYKKGWVYTLVQRRRNNDYPAD